MAADLTALTASQAADDIANGNISAQDYTAACLQRIAATEGDVRAFVHIDPEHALRQARALDERRRDGQPLGPLHGIPVGIKDIFDTADYKTEYGSPLFKDRQPSRDSVAVARLRAAGAVIVGKTVTTECAYFHPGPTRNPHDLTRTPGGSSSGSAAAVGAGMIPLAIGCLLYTSGVLVGTVAAAIIGPFIARLRGVYFAMCTIAFGQVFYFIAFQWRDVTGGDDGLSAWHREPLHFGFATLDILNDNKAFYYMALAFFAAGVGIMAFILRSPFGRTLLAIRENERRARFLGIPVDRHIWLSWVISCGMVSLAGSLYAPVSYTHLDVYKRQGLRCNLPAR